MRRTEKGGVKWMQKQSFLFVLRVVKFQFVAPLCLLTKTSLEYFPLMRIKSPSSGNSAMTAHPCLHLPSLQEEDDLQEEEDELKLVHPLHSSAGYSPPAYSVEKW